MAVKFFSKQSPKSKPPQFYNKVSLLNLSLIVIVINVVVDGFSGEGLK